jgi:hypothetical protein
MGELMIGLLFLDKKHTKKSGVYCHYFFAYWVTIKEEINRPEGLCFVVVIIPTAPSSQWALKSVALCAPAAYCCLNN